MPGISAREYQRRLAPMLKMSAVKELAYNELIKEEGNLLQLKKEELLHGVRPDNKPIGYYRSKGYKNKKLKLNPLANGRVDLIFSGSFINSFYLLKTPQPVALFGATDKKRNSLVGKYGIDIMGLNSKVFSKFETEIIAPRLVRTIKTKFNIG